MPKEIDELHHDFYPLEEAARVSGISIHRLIRMGADGKLPIYVLAHLWATRAVYEIDTNGRIRIVDSNGPEGALYCLPLSNEQPLAEVCLREFKNKPENVTIRLDLNRILPYPDDGILRGLIPEVPFFLSEDRMVVSVNDLSSLADEATPGSRIGKAIPDCPEPAVVELEKEKIKTEGDRSGTDLNARVDEKVRETVSERARMAAKKKHSITDATKTIVLDQYKAGQWPSVAAAARDIYANLGIRQQNLKSTNALRTIGEWISDYKKGLAQE